MTLSRIVKEDVRYRARDGVLLAADVCRADDGQPHPTLLIRTPYGRAGGRAGVDVFALVNAGWTVVSADTRGRNDSEGDSAPYVTEADDGADTLAWCLTQPWCDGRIAGTGASYLGFTQWQSASSGHPALKAIAPSQAPTGLREGWHYEGGAFLASHAAQWGSVMADQGRAATPEGRAQLQSLTRDPAAFMATAPSEHPLRELYEPYAHWIQEADTEYWARFEFSPRTQPIDVAGFHIAGWYDPFCEAGIDAWRQLREHGASAYARASQRLVIGHWPHGMGAQTIGEVDYLAGSDLGGSGVIADLYPWLRDAIDGKPVQGGVRVFVMGSNRWWDLPDWPPPADELELNLGDGELSTALCDVGVTVFLHDPHNPVPTRGGRILGLWRPLPGPYDQREIERREDVLVYTSAPLPGPLTIAGSVRSHLTFSTSAVSADVTAKLVDVQPDGRAINLLDSIRRSAFIPGIPDTVTVELGSVAHTFLAGHCIRLEVASSNAPRFNPNPSTGAALHEPGPMLRANQQLHHGGRSGSRLVLPVVANLDGAPHGAALAALGRHPAR